MEATPGSCWPWCWVSWSHIIAVCESSSGYCHYALSRQRYMSQDADHPVINGCYYKLHSKAFAYHFIFSDRWTLEELSSVMHVPPGLLKRRLGFWISQGVLKEESTDTFVVVEKQKGQQRLPGMLNCRPSSGLLKGRGSGSRKLFSPTLPWHLT